MEVKGKKQPKKLTAAQLESKLRNSIVFVPRDSHTKSIYFSDKGLRLVVTEDTCVISTAFHSHVFSAITASGYSRPYLYTKQFLEIALKHADDILVKDEKGEQYYSFARLFEYLKDKKEIEAEYNICWLVEKWLHSIFAPLYEIDETQTSAFLVYETYMHTIARQSFLLAEHKEDVTNKQFVDAVLEKEKSFIEGVEEMVILHAKTDEERAKEEMEALQEQAVEEGMKKQIEADGTTNK